MTNQNSSPAAKSIAVVLFCTGTALVSFSPAFAASDSFCNAYARKAAAQQHENLKLGCGFHSLRWNDDGPAAFIYCKAVGQGLANAETTERENKLISCRKAKSQDQAGQQDQAEPAEVLNAGQPGSAQGCKPALSRRAAGTTKTRARNAAKGAWQSAARSKYGKPFANFDLARDASYTCKGSSGSYTCQAVGKACSGVSNVNNGQLSDTESSTSRCKAKLVRKGFGNTTDQAEEAAVTNWEAAAKIKHGARFAKFSLSKGKSLGCIRPISSKRVKCTASGSPCDGIRTIKKN